tara:strand:+ start:1157 stop:1519 length:363 start_codon:yes stop_codon:yes gene_type:complete
MDEYLYHYKAEVISVYDGDTITIMMDMGMSHFARIKVRLLGIDTPEIRTRDLEEKKLGLSARDYLRERLMDKTIIIKTVKKGKFGRWLGIIWLLDEKALDTMHESINDELIRTGHAVKYG